jgi:uncharacterized membrane protein
MDMESIFQKLRNHIITGFIFVMPILICLIVIGKFWNDLLKYGSKVNKFIGFHSLLGSSGDAVLALILFLVICTGAGFLIRISFLKRFSGKIDEKLGQIIPGYTQIKSQTQKQIGIEKKEDRVYPACLVKVHDLWQPGYIVEDNQDGTNTVFVPQAPTHASGQVYVVQTDQLRRLDMDSKSLNNKLQQLGKGIKDQ